MRDELPQERGVTILIEALSPSQTDVVTVVRADGVVRYQSAHIEGDYAIALWDARRRRLVLARDRVGKKPLYYYTRNGTFYFASETKAILAAIKALDECDLDLGSLDE